MTPTESDQRAVIRNYILEEFLPGESPDSLDDDTPLITGGILDSIGTVKLMGFLERHFGVVIEPHEMNADFMDSVSDIQALVAHKLNRGG
jgi:acyl carrier protein